MTPAQKRRLGREASRIARKILVSICAQRLKVVRRKLKRHARLREELRQVIRTLENLNR